MSGGLLCDLWAFIIYLFQYLEVKSVGSLNWSYLSVQLQYAGNCSEFSLNLNSIVFDSIRHPYFWWLATGYSLCPDFSNAAKVSVSLIERSMKGRQPNSGGNGTITIFLVYSMHIDSHFWCIRNYLSLLNLLLLEDLIYPKQHWREVKKISVESFFWKVVQFDSYFAHIFLFSLQKIALPFKRLTSSQPKTSYWEQFCLCREYWTYWSDLHTVAALDKSDVPNLPDFIRSYEIIRS